MDEIKITPKDWQEAERNCANSIENIDKKDSKKRSDTCRAAKTKVGMDDLKCEYTIKPIKFIESPKPRFSRISIDVFKMGKVCAPDLRMKDAKLVPDLYGCPKTCPVK